MRPPRESLLLLGLLTAFCLTGGVIAGIATGVFVATPQATPTVTLAPATVTPAAPEVTVSVTPGPQKTLLLIGVTDGYAPEPVLETCWVITFRSGVPDYYVLAVPPSAVFDVASLDGPRTLTQIHAEDLRLQLDHNFVRDAIEARFPAFTIQTDLTLDRSDLSALVGQLGGLTLDNRLLTGPALLQTYDTWPAASDLERLDLQGDILEHLFALLAQRAWSAADLVAFATQLPRIQADAATVAELQAFAEGAPPLSPNSLVWRRFGPEMEAATVPLVSQP